VPTAEERHLNEDYIRNAANWMLATGDILHIQHFGARYQLVMIGTEGSSNILFSSGKCHLKLN
jgi:hypothetical protein